MQTLTEAYNGPTNHFGWRATITVDHSAAVRLIELMRLEPELCYSADTLSSLIGDRAPRRAAPHGPQEYKGNGKHDWERVNRTTCRLRVPGGWIYNIDGSRQVSNVFVPMPEIVGYKV